MTIHEKMQTVLTAVLTGYVSAAHVRGPGDWQNMARPYVVHFWSATEATETTDGTDNIRIHDYKVAVFEDDWGSGEAICDVLRDNVPGIHDGVNIRWIRSEYGGMDDDTKVHEFMVTYEVAGKL